jgi:DNA polymerase
MTAADFVPADTDLDGLRAAARDCRGCELWEPATQTVFSVGPPDARVVLVGEQPGDQEDRQGAPFVGPAGHVLVRAVDEAGIERSTIYRTNVVKHFRFTQAGPGKRRIHQTPDRVHVEACRPWLRAELAVLSPVVIASAAKPSRSRRAQPPQAPHGSWPPSIRRLSCAPTTASRRTAAWWRTSGSRRVS